MEIERSQRESLTFLNGVTRCLRELAAVLELPIEEEENAEFVSGLTASLKAVSELLANGSTDSLKPGAVMPLSLHARSQEVKSVVERLQAQVGQAAEEASKQYFSEQVDENPTLLGESTDHVLVKSNGEAEHGVDEAVDSDGAHSERNTVFLCPDEETQNTDIFMRRVSTRRSEGTFLFNPTWNGKMTWDFFVMFLVIMDAFLLPFQLSFKHGREPDDFDTFWFWITFLTFSTDIFCTFNTAIELDEDGTPDSVLRDRRLIAKAYVKGWFILDFSSTVPWGPVASIITGDQGGGGGAAKLMKILKFLRIMRLMRMLRMAKLKAIWESIETYMGSLVFVQTVMLFKVLVTVVAICHWSACLFWMVGCPSSLVTDLLPNSVSEPFAALPHWTTVARITYTGQEPWSFQDIPYQEQYLFCFYWSLGVMRTMPAEVTPVNIPERVFVLLFMFFALAAFAISLGSLTQAYFKIAERSRGFDGDMFCVRMHLKKIGLERSIARQCTSYVLHLFDRRRIMAKESGLLDKLPHILKQEIKDAQTMKQLQIFPVIQELAKSEVKEICKYCDMYDRLPNDVICIAGQLAKAAWILVEGRCQADSRDRPKVVMRSPDVVDGDCLLTVQESFSSATVVTITCCEMLRVDKDHFVKFAVLGHMVVKDWQKKKSLAIGIAAMSDGKMGHGDSDAAAAATAAGCAG
eukprot:TRINITY_DN26982_c0_g1_i1.p1 TRINITY_DN26982_c0_g1~~TRINITY_DN26982_c0_g1_i1.p1  ORF type:complete len:691 (+),score=112.11 TRINITY_DN26982_c0_g1_i1:79-2151(+)